MQAEVSKQGEMELLTPPRNWTERPSRPLTRSVAAWRERDRGYTDKGAEQWYKRGQLDYNEEKKNTLTCDLCIFDYCWKEGALCRCNIA